MDRKSFLKNMGLGSGSLLLLGGAATNSEGASVQNEESEKFTHGWVKALLENINSTLSNEEGINLLEECGRSCAKRGAVNMAKEFAGNVEGFLTKMEEILGKGNAFSNGSEITFIYPKCFCPLVSKMKEELPENYCNCSRGWVKEMLETVVQGKVNVVLEESIKRGGKQCRFKVEYS